MAETYEWNVRPTIFEDGIVPDITDAQCVHCGRGGIPLALLGDQTHAAETQYALVCYECLREVATILGAA